MFSGRLLRLFPPKTLASVLRSLVDGLNDREAQKATRWELNTVLEQLELRVRLRPGNARRLTSSGVSGETLLRVYFAQIMTQDSAFLDMRSGAFEENVWKPGRLFVSWDQAFLSAVRDMYVSF